MSGVWTLSFLNIGLPESLVIGGVLLLFFAPGLARSLGGVVRTLFEVKRGVDTAKSDLTRTVTSQIHRAIGGIDKEVERRPKKAPPKDDA